MLSCRRPRPQSKATLVDASGKQLCSNGSLAGRRQSCLGDGGQLLRQPQKVLLQIEILNVAHQLHAVGRHAQALELELSPLFRSPLRAARQSKYFRFERRAQLLAKLNAARCGEDHPAPARNDLFFEVDAFILTL